MNDNHNTHFVIFIIALIITIVVFTIAALYPILGWDKKDLIYLAFSQFLVTIITPVGIFSAYKAKNNTFPTWKDKVGLWGNLVLFVFTMSIAIRALL